MAYYNTCPICGAILDPGEKCDCQEISARNAAKWEHLTRQEDGGQFRLLPETTTKNGDLEK